MKQQRERRDSSVDVFANASDNFETEFEEWLAKISIPPPPSMLTNESMTRNVVHANSTVSVNASENSGDISLQRFDNKLLSLDSQGTVVVYENTGCQIFYMLTIFNGTTKPQRIFSVDYTPEAKRAVFVLDWTKLWSRLISRHKTMTTNAFALEMPFLHVCFQIFLSSKMLTFSIAITLYDGIAYLIGNLLYPTVSSTINVWVSFALAFIILMGARIVKGSFFENGMKGWCGKSKKSNGNQVPVPMTDYILSFLDNDVPTKPTENHEILEASRGLKVLRQGLHPSWFQLLKDLYSSFVDVMTQDVIGLFVSRTGQKGEKQKKSGELAVISFYQLVCISTLYLRSMKIGNFKFTPRKYTNALMIFFFTFTIGFALYLTIETIAEIHACHYHHHWGFISDNEQCNYLNLMALLTLGQSITFLSYVLSFLQFITIFAILLFGADIANGLAIYWLLRFRPLRRIASFGNSSENENDDGNEMKTDKNKEMENWIQRDAYERYLFISSYFQKCSDFWGWFLSISLGLCICLCAYGYSVVLYYYVSEGIIDVSGVSICVITAFIFTYVVLSLAYANSAIDSILTGFQYCGIDDYQLLGGKDKWIEYVKNSPIYWYLLGFPITRSWLISFFGGAITAVIGGLITAYATETLTPPSGDT